MSKSIGSPITRVIGTLVAVVLISAPSLAAQTGNVTGRITHALTGSPIPAVQVFISSLDLGGLTQQNGRYLLQNVPTGTHTLSVARIGYPITQVQITVARNRTVEQNFAISKEQEPLARPRPPTYPYWFVPTPPSARTSKD